MPTRVVTSSPRPGDWRRSTIRRSFLSSVSTRRCAPGGGEPLDQLTGAGHALAARKIALLLIQIADAVEAFHAHGFVHLDLKPANVLIAADGHQRLPDFR